MRKLGTVVLVLAVFSATANAQFAGELVLEPEGCSASGTCKLKNDFRFTDGAAVVWAAAAGDETDGASIPPLFQPLVGKPFEASFIKAAVIHDHYCKRRVRSWRATHRVFYEGLVSQGVAKAKAKLMYYAVYLGGPKWVELVPGKNCGQNCINSIKSSSGGPTELFREADYASSVLPLDLAALQAQLEADPEALSLTQLEQRARSKRPDDYYFRNGSKVEVSGTAITQ